MDNKVEHHEIEKWALFCKNLCGGIKDPSLIGLVLWMPFAAIKTAADITTRQPPEKQELANTINKLKSLDTLQIYYVRNRIMETPVKSNASQNLKLSLVKADYCWMPYYQQLIETYLLDSNNVGKKLQCSIINFINTAYDRQLNPLLSIVADKKNQGLLFLLMTVTFQPGRLDNNCKIPLDLWNLVFYFCFQTSVDETQQLSVSMAKQYLDAQLFFCRDNQLAHSSRSNLKEITTMENMKIFRDNQIAKLGTETDDRLRRISALWCSEDQAFLPAL